MDRVDKTVGDITMKKPLRDMHLSRITFPCPLLRRARRDFIVLLRHEEVDASRGAGGFSARGAVTCDLSRRSIVSYLPRAMLKLRLTLELGGPVSSYRISPQRQDPEGIFRNGIERLDMYE